MKAHLLFIRLLTPLPFLTLALTLTLTVLPAFSAESGIGLNPTALDYYVREPDLNYKYDVVKTIEEEDYKTFIIEMTSQQWLTEAEVNFPIYGNTLWWWLFRI